MGLTYEGIERVTITHCCERFGWLYTILRADGSEEIRNGPPDLPLGPVTVRLKRLQRTLKNGADVDIRIMET